MLLSLRSFLVLGLSFAVPCCGPICGHAQQPVPPLSATQAVPQSVPLQAVTQSVQRADLPPSSIYEQVLSPFSQVRDDMGNWSEVELAAFQAVTEAAKQECDRLEQTPHEGEEELALARLCTLGHEWDGAFSAARWYTRRNAPPEDQTHLPTGFALLIQSDLNLQHVPAALEHVAEMSERLPLTIETSTIFRFTINALEVTQLPSAVDASRIERAALLKAIASQDTATNLPPGQAEADAWHALALLHQAGLTGEEQAIGAELTQALAQRPPLAPAEAFTAQQGQRAYEWLGKPLPPIVDKPGPERAAVRNAALSAGPGLLVIQRDDAADLPALNAGVDGLRKRMQGGPSITLVLVRVLKPQKPAAVKPPATVPQALLTTQNLFDIFAATSGPLFVLRDAQNRVAFLGSGNAAWLNPMAHAESLLARVTPEEAPKGASASKPAH